MATTVKSKLTAALRWHKQRPSHRRNLDGRQQHASDYEPRSLLSSQRRDPPAIDWQTLPPRVHRTARWRSDVPLKTDLFGEHSKQHTTAVTLYCCWILLSRHGQSREVLFSKVFLPQCKMLYHFTVS